MEGLDCSIVVSFVVTAHRAFMVIDFVLDHHPLAVSSDTSLLGHLAKSNLTLLKSTLKGVMVTLFSVL